MTRWKLFKRPSMQEQEDLVIGWNFPLNEGGPEAGINDAGIETYKGRPLPSLAREICQNSLDARSAEAEGPVLVTFSLENISADQFPGREEFHAVLGACLDYWRERNKKARKFFETALKVFGRDHFTFLRIGDSNTTGLRGASHEGPSEWHNLIKAVGVSDKGAGQGGSFGIGKYAAFACSELRTIFYSTNDRDGVKAFQGVSRLVTHKSPKRQGQTTQALGFYGVEERNRPILNPAAIPDLFLRENVGTDVIIAGFSYADRWEEEIAKSIISDFFLAIHRDLLVARVGRILVNKGTLPDLVREYFENDSECHAHKYFSCLVSENVAFREEFDGFGPVALYVRRDNNGPKKVAMFRSTGMMIKEKGHFRTPIKFAGVFEAEGGPMNEMLRSLEPPGHDNWQPDRVSDDQEEIEAAKDFLSKLYAWINNKVRQVVQAEQAEQVDAAGMGRFLPDDLDQDQPLDQEESGGEPIKSSIEELRRPSRREETPPEGGQPGPEGEGNGPTSEWGSGRNVGSEGQPATGGGGGGEGEGTSGTASGAGGRRSTSSRPLSLERVRTYCVDSANGVYRLVLVPKENGAAHIRINYVGEEGWENAIALAARFVDSGEPIPVDSRGRIGPLPLEKGKRYLMEVNMNERMRCALGVVADAN